MAKLLNRILSLYAPALLTNENVWAKISKIQEYLETEEKAIPELLGLQGMIETFEMISVWFIISVV